ncbi:MAG TPA: HlyD family efflux transporter periplasmic adaptor subunit [Desulfobacterales bacterium]|nr:HlyD family efflux transporter periplasmic adaptor subunit [Desulfobacterales bacterium]
MTETLPQESNQELLKVQPPDPARLAEQIAGILAGKDEEKEKIGYLLQLAIGLVNGAGAVFFVRQEEEIRPAVELISRQAASWSNDISGELQESAKQALEQGKASISSLAQLSSVRILSCPVPATEEQQACCLSVLVLFGDSPREPFLIILQLMASALAQVVRRKGKSQIIPGDSASLLHLLLRQKEKLNLREMCDLLRNWSGCSMLAIGIGNKNGRVRLHAVSDMVKIDSRTRQSRQFIKVMQECQQHLRPSLWPGEADDTRYEQSLLMKELVRATGMQQGAAVFLPGAGRDGSLVVFLWPEEEGRASLLTEFSEISSLLGPAFQAIISSGHSKKVEADAGAMSGKKKRIIAGAVAFLIFGIALFPKTFNLHPDTRVKPVQVRYVVARFDGILEQVFVEPGDRVQKDAPLAKLDGREIDLELRSIEADNAKALKMRDNYLATGDIAPAQIALLEARRLQERSSLLRDRQQKLDLDSPLEGIVLTGDLKQEVGGPVTRGQMLFEIAPLETVLIELAVPDEDVSYVKKDMEVEIRFDAFPGRTWKATIDRIAPKSDLVQGVNVFLTTLELKNDNRMLQPGMQGHAKVNCGRRSLAWIYFHKPWYALSRLLNKLF